MVRQAGLLVLTFVAVLALLGGVALFLRTAGPAASQPPSSAATAGNRASGESGTPSGGSEIPGSASPSASAAEPGGSASVPPLPSTAGDPILVGAGDIASCASNGDEATAALVAQLPTTAVVFTSGDNAYDSGTSTEFSACYDPSWGRFKARTRPALGTHDAVTKDAAGYFGYFGAAAGSAPDGWYSYDLGTWHVIVLNSTCPGRDGCTAGSPQGMWLQADLAADHATCTLAIWHAPRFSSGSTGGSSTVAPFWSLLYAAGADVLVNGDDHDYERFVPQDPSGGSDPQRGIVEFVAGTGGGGELGDFGRIVAANSLIRASRIAGVLELTLRRTGYDFQFISTDGSFNDRGTGVCH